jgi:hypothetical protein
MKAFPDSEQLRTKVLKENRDVNRGLCAYVKLRFRQHHQELRRGTSARLIGGQREVNAFIESIGDNTGLFHPADVQSSRIVAACNGRGATCGLLMKELRLPADWVYKLVQQLVANGSLRKEMRGGKRYLFDNNTHQAT